MQIILYRLMNDTRMLFCCMCDCGRGTGYLNMMKFWMGWMSWRKSLLRTRNYLYCIIFLVDNCTMCVVSLLSFLLCNRVYYLYVPVCINLDFFAKSLNFFPLSLCFSLILSVRLNDMECLCVVGILCDVKRILIGPFFVLGDNFS